MRIVLLVFLGVSANVVVPMGALTAQQGNAEQSVSVPFVALSVASDTSPVTLRIDGLYRTQGDRLQVLVTRVFLSSLLQEIDIRALRFHLYPPSRGVLPAAPGAVTQLLSPRTLVTQAVLVDTLAIQLRWGYDPREEIRLHISLLDTSRQVIGRAESGVLRDP